MIPGDVGIVSGVTQATEIAREMFACETYQVKCPCTMLMRPMSLDKRRLDPYRKE